MGHRSYCAWCHEPLPALPEDASYVDELNHTMHDHCRKDQNAFLENRDLLMASIADATADPMPVAIRVAYLESVRDAGLVRRCPCLYDLDHGFRGYASHSWDRADGRDYDARNAVPGCPLCAGTGRHDRLPELLTIKDDAVAAHWIKDKILLGAGPLRGHGGWYHSTLERSGGRRVDGVVLYNVTLLQGGIIAWMDVAEVFRPRVQQSFF
ncbi:MAG: hypothetical protein M3277_12060 [Actinomycetota bacterium]|nr:hypothetical protein [Actinomycetota bacterium]